MVAGGNRDHVQILVLQGLADVLHALRLHAAQVFDLLGAHGKQRAVRVDQIRHLYARYLGELADVGAAPAFDAGHTHADHVVGPQHTTRGLGAGNHETAGDAGRSRCGLQETSARKVGHRVDSFKLWEVGSHGGKAAGSPAGAQALTPSQHKVILPSGANDASADERSATI